jgi:integrase
MSKAFVTKGLELYEKHRTKQDVTQIILDHATSSYKKLNTRASALGKLKRVILDKHFPNEEDEIPPAVQNMMLSKKQYDAINAVARGKLKKRSKECIEVDFKEYMKVWESVKDTTDPSTLCLWVGAMTGRRSAEITNGRSTFTEMKANQFELVFNGQLKTRDPLPYAIPTLAPGKDVIANYKRFIEMNTTLTSTVLGRKLRSLFPAPLELTKPHQLRAIYAQACWELYGQKTKQAQHDYISDILGHNGYSSVINYNCVKLSNVSLPISENSFDLPKNKANTKCIELIVAYHKEHNTMPSVNWLRKQSCSYQVAKRVLNSLR